MTARQWLFEVAAPVWAATRHPISGLLAERLTLDGAIDPVPRRLFVQARHIYSFVTLGRLGWQGPWQEIAAGITDHLLAHAFRPDGLVLHRFDADGRPFDLRTDLYDQAFFLLAMAEAARGLGRADALTAAHRLMDALEAQWRHSAGGFQEGEINPTPRRQNPHMHLLEALLALDATEPGARWAGLAQEIVTLCLTRFIDPASGALLEFFAPDLVPLDAAKGQQVEPGHCFEWAWLLERASAIHPAALAAADGLTAFARAHGLDAGRGIAIDAVAADGRVLDAGARLWPQTERLKIAIARLRRLDNAAEVQAAEAAFLGLQSYLDMPVAGTWRDRLLPDGAWVEEPARGSSLYHITCAYADLMEATAF